LAMGRRDSGNGGRSGTATRDASPEQEESAVSNEVATGAPEREEARDRGARGRAGARPARTAPRSTGFALRIYKSGQGYYTRVGTAVGLGVLVVCGAVFLLNELGSIDLSQKALLPVQYGVTVGFIVAMAGLIYWLVGVSRKANDFFIATEGEMKKVSWSTRKEVVRSTKVVIVTVILMAVFLFVADIVFMAFFNAIGVLKGGPGLLKLFGIEP